MKRTATSLAAALLFASWAGAQVTIEVGSLTTVPGGSGLVDVTVRTSHEDVGGTGNGIGWSGPLSFSDCIANPEIQREATAFGFMPSGCRETGDCTSMRALVLSFGFPELPPPLEDGALLYSCEVTVFENAPPGDYALSCGGPEAATRSGLPIDADCADGLVLVREPTRTPTSTSTPIMPSPTPTATAAPSTPTPPPCPGDCDGDQVVSINELVAAVRIALEEVGVAFCPAANPDRDLVVAIDELVRAVRAALDGC